LSSALTPCTPRFHHTVNGAWHIGTVSINLVWRAGCTILAFFSFVGPSLKWLSLNDLDATIAIGIKTCAGTLTNNPVTHHAILDHQLWFLSIRILDFVVHGLPDLEEATHFSLQLFALVVAFLELLPQLFTQLTFEC
jgi:hypothetical protein